MVGVSFMPMLSYYASLSSVVQQASSTSTASTISAPADVLAGDILVLLDRCFANSGTPALVTPTDFTLIDTQSVTQRRQTLTFKLADGSEASSSITGQDSTITEKILVVYRGSRAIGSAVAGGAVSSGFTDGNPAAQTVLSAAAAAPLIVLGAYASSGTVNPRTFTAGGIGVKDGEVIHPSTNSALAFKFYGSAPADIVVDMDDEGNGNCVQGCYITLS